MWIQRQVDPASGQNYFGIKDAVDDWHWRQMTFETLYQLASANQPALAVKEFILAAPEDLPSHTRPAIMLTSGRRVFCIGKNYQKHAQEMGSEAPIAPDVFMRGSESFVTCGEDIILSSKSAMHDFEGELVVHMGKAGRYIKAEEAYDHIFGYGIANDGSVRDWQKRTSQFTLGKNWDKSGALSSFIRLQEPTLSTEALTLTTSINGQQMQQGSTAEMIHSIPQLIETLSTVTCLMPGDCILTGTPDGVGVARSPQIFMKSGDAVKISIDLIGALHHGVTG